MLLHICVHFQVIRSTYFTCNFTLILEPRAGIKSLLVLLIMGYGKNNRNILQTTNFPFLHLKPLVRVWFWLYLTKGLIWHISQSSIRPSFYFSSIVISRRIRSWNQPVLSHKGKVSCSRKQRGLWWGSNPRPQHVNFSCR